MCGWSLLYVIDIPCTWRLHHKPCTTMPGSSSLILSCYERRRGREHVHIHRLCMTEVWLLLLRGWDQTTKHKHDYKIQVIAHNSCIEILLILKCPYSFCVQQANIIIDNVHITITLRLPSLVCNIMNTCT